MKIISQLLFLACLLMVSTIQVQAQELSKADKKKWKNIAKDYAKNPEALKTLSEEHRQLKRNAGQQEAEVAALKQGAQEKDRRIEMLLAEMNQLRSKLADAQSQATSRPPQRPVVQQTTTMTDDSGIWFKVQIGAFEDRQIDPALQTSDNLTLEGDDIQKVMIGKYRNYDDAERLKSHMVSIGLSDAWVVSYRDGVRIPIEEARNN